MYESLLIIYSYRLLGCRVRLMSKLTASEDGWMGERLTIYKQIYLAAHMMYVSFSFNICRFQCVYMEAYELKLKKA